jgi:hypothetical protein
LGNPEDGKLGGWEDGKPGTWEKSGNLPSFLTSQFLFSVKELEP